MEISNLNLTSIAGLTAIGAVIATTWRHIANFGRYLIGIVIGTSVVKDDAGNAVMAYAFSRGIRSPLGMRVFGGFESYVHPKRWIESVAYEAISTDPVLIRFGRQFALISMTGSNSVERVGEFDNRSRVITIKYFRWFFNIEKFTTEAIEYYNSCKRQGIDKNKPKQKTFNRFRVVRFSGGSDRGYREEAGSQGSKPHSPLAETSSPRSIEQLVATGVYRLLKWKREDLQMKPEEGQSAFTGYPFPKEVERAITELDLWLSQEKWFRSKSIPWRRGWLLYGPPGTGKSTLVRALGMSFDLPVFIFDLSGMSNDALCKSWDEMMNSTPCIALIEDIDNIFNGREYVGAQSQGVPHVTFDCLLNCISGVKQADGVFLIVTTNHIDKLDPALGIPDATGRSTRPGRIDKALELGLMAKEQRLALAKHILSDFPDLIEETVIAGEGETAAQFQARCAGLALDKFWKDGKKVVVNEPTYVEAVHVSTPVPGVDYAHKNDIVKLYGKLGK